MKEQKTFVVLGNYRGGTSVVAGLLRLAGVMMGEHIDDIKHEDLDFQMATIPRIKQLIAERNKVYDIWGWKDPDTINKIQMFHHFIRNPHFIIIFRDPYAVALTEEEAIGQEIVQGMIRANKVNKELIDFIRMYDYPMLLMSFEKLIRNKEKEIKKLICFLGFDVDNNRKERMLEFVSPEKRYHSI